VELDISLSEKVPGPHDFEMTAPWQFPDAEQEGVWVVSPVTFRGFFTMTDNKQVVLKGRMAADLQMTCARCLERFLYPLSIDFEEKFVKNPADDVSDEAFTYRRHALDLTDMTHSLMVTHLPMKPLCKPDCVGWGTVIAEE
jgi:uncharacterized protein